MTDGRPITVVGDGQMGLVCAGLLCEAAAGAGASTPGSGRVRLWGHDATELSLLAQKRKSWRLPGFTLPEQVDVIPDDEEALERAGALVAAVPTQHARAVWQRLSRHVPPGVRVVSVAKGIENETLLRPSEVIRECLPGAAAVGALSGPTIAPELARRLPATMVAASDDAGGAFAQDIQRMFATSWMRIYTNTDLTGVELAGAVKNVIAIAAGALDGLHAGCNAKSALLARGLAEIVRLGLAMGARQETFFGVAGVGDLATSCFSPEGRNRSLGEALGKGESLDSYLARTRSVVEGVATTRSVMDLARRHNVEMPIAAAVHAALFEGVDPIEAITALMGREMKAERVG